MHNVVSVVIQRKRLRNIFFFPVSVGRKKVIIRIKANVGEILVFAAYTYFYQGSNYWRFDNRRIEADPGYPRSILKDFMGCRGAPDPKPDTDAQQEPKHTPANPPDRDQDRASDPNRDGSSEEGPTSKPDPADHDEDGQVNVVVTVADSETKVMTLVMVIVPLVLILCILILIYAILRTLQNKEPPRALVHCKRSLQDWV